MPVSKEQILAALERITDPQSGKSVVEAGLIEGLVVRDGNIGFAVEVPAALGPKAEPLRKACEDAVLRLPGVTSVTAVLTAHQEPANARRAAPQGHGHAHGPQAHGGTTPGIAGVAN